MRSDEELAFSGFVCPKHESIAMRARSFAAVSPLRMTL